MAWLLHCFSHNYIASIIWFFSIQSKVGVKLLIFPITVVAISAHIYNTHIYCIEPLLLLTNETFLIFVNIITLFIS